MTKWEYMFVDYRDYRIIRIYFPDAAEAREYKNPEHRYEWKSWLRSQGTNGWEHTAEYSLNGDTVHATLKRPIEDAKPQ